MCCSQPHPLSLQALADKHLAVHHLSQDSWKHPAFTGSRQWQPTPLGKVEPISTLTTIEILYATDAHAPGSKSQTVCPECCQAHQLQKKCKHPKRPIRQERSANPWVKGRRRQEGEGGAYLRDASSLPSSHRCLTQRIQQGCLQKKQVER